MFYAIVGDIVSSKSIDERTRVQNKLEDFLKVLNEEYSSSIKKNLAVTLGDEFQGLFTSSIYILEIIHKIEAEMWPTKLRFGVGIGDMSFDFGNTNSPYQSDGEVWWNARKAITEVKEKKSTNKLEYFSNLNIKCSDENINKHVNTVMDLCYSIKINWTEKQNILINYTINKYGLNNNFVIKQVASEFKQSTSTIYKKYKSAKYLNYVETVMSIAEMINMEDVRNAI